MQALASLFGGIDWPWNVASSINLNISDDDAPRYLGTYSFHDVVENLEKYGIIEIVEKAGFKPVVRLDTRDHFVHKLHVEDPNWTGKQGIIHLIELYMRRKLFSPTDFTVYYLEPEAKQFLQSHLPPALEISVVEWLRLQNPARPFSSSRPQLPGQDYPGLGCAKEFHTLLSDLARKHSRAGILCRPEFFHNAYFYSLKGYHFISPYHEGLMLALIAFAEKEIPQHSLAEISLELSLARHCSVNGSPYQWKAEGSCS